MSDPPNRRFWQIHLLTAVLIMILAGMSVKLLVEASYSRLMVYYSIFGSVAFIVASAMVLEIMLRGRKSATTQIFLAASLVCAGGLAVFNGVREIRWRNIAHNEENAHAACRSFAEAEELFHRIDLSGNGTYCYALRLNGDEPESLLGQKLIEPKIAMAETSPGPAIPSDGYFFKVLTAQAGWTTGGKRNYIVNGKMTLGYALIAYPAEFGVSGTASFIINNNGTVFSHDLGPNTLKIASDMTEFYPDPVWGPENN